MSNCVCAVTVSRAAMVQELTAAARVMPSPCRMQSHASARHATVTQPAGPRIGYHLIINFNLLGLWRAKDHIVEFQALVEQFASRFPACERGFLECAVAGFTEGGG